MTDVRASLPTVPGLTGLSVLARGGHATVYRAVQASVGREVAVKVENRRLESERDQRRFLREASAAGRMSGHPNVIDLFDAGVTVKGYPYLIMELCQGSYAERMKTNPLSPVEARDVGVKIADALADAHALGVLHRDVKPANLLLSRFGEPQLADFGLAILAEMRDHSITLDVLTPAYAPPEMFRYAKPSPAADVYALCATLHALMSGRPPRWPDGMPSLVALFEMFSEPVPDIPGVPAEMTHLLRAGMANDEHARPSATDVRDTLVSLSFDLGPHRPTALPRRSVFTPPHGAATSPAPVSPAPMYPGDDEQTLSPGDRPVAESPMPPVGQPGVSPGAQGGGDPHRRVRRRWLWLGIAVGCVSMLTAAAVFGWFAANHRTATPRPQARPGGTPAPTASPTGSPQASGTAAGAPCELGVAAPSMRCVSTPECYDALTVNGGVASAKPVPCEQPHVWEVFGIDSLPAGLTTVDYQSVKGHQRVRSACNVGTLATLDISLFAWQVDVLPPSPKAYQSGDRTFRCLAGPANAKTTGSKLARS